ncbi:MAG: type III-B CRISPR module-associated protein Cmr5 [Planctomycetes bacterium]|nr:type III-B CRISPR module-associated protein Cmr5 [Planctomycetota bacterium]
MSQSQATQPSKPTLDQRRAKHAWDAVQDAKNKAGVHLKREPKKFGGQAKKLPTRIMASGLGQALAFLYAKGYADGLLQEIADWVLDKRASPESHEPKPQKDELIKAIIAGNSDFLRRATDETLAYLQWLNRFAEAEGLTEGD